LQNYLCTYINVVDIITMINSIPILMIIVVR